MNTATYQFIAQRMSGVLLVPLGLWFLFSLVRLKTSDPTAVITWLQKSYVMLLMLLFVGNLFYHAFLGIQSIIEDYVDHPLYRDRYIQTAWWIFISASAICAMLILILFAFGTSQ